MKYNYRKALFVFVIAALVSVSISWNRVSLQDDRNLKVLPKNISSDSLERVMDEFVTALNVNCAYCHAAKDPAQPKKLDYASDLNPHKDVTRQMMRMTMDINNKYLEPLRNTASLMVSCNTCHRGEPVPRVK